MTEQLRQAMRAAGIDYAGPLVGDGKLHRFKPEGDRERNSWYVLHNGTIQAGAFGCWKRGIKQTWHEHSNRTYSPAEREEFRRQQQAREQETADAQTKAQRKAKWMFGRSEPVNDHPYLSRKGIKAYGMVRLWRQRLILPLCDLAGELRSVQFIGADGRKLFPRDSRVDGCCYTVCDRADGPLLLCEGYATGASIHEATGHAVICALNAGNLLAVAQNARKKWPDREIIIAGDNDAWTQGNPGVTKATEAAHAIRARLVVPKFEDTSTKPTDFNDLQHIAGSDAVKAQIEGPPHPWLKLLEDAADIVTLEIPPVVEIVEGLVTELSKFVIGSGSKSFKTWITIALALCISHGKPFWGRATIRRRVLYINLELKPRTFQRRVQTLAKALKITVDRSWFHHVPLRGHIAGLSVMEIVGYIIDLTKHIQGEVTVCDPVYKMNVEGEENNSRDQTLFFNELDRLTTKAGTTLILNDHFGKGNQAEKDPLDAIRGSSAKGGDVDAAMVLRKHEVEGCFRVDVIHRELPPVEPFVMGWEFPLMELRTDLDPEKMKFPKGGRKKQRDPLELLAAIRDTTPEEPISIAAWAIAVNMPRKTLDGYLPQMRTKRWIRTVGDGKKARQHITQEGLEALE